MKKNFRRCISLLLSFVMIMTASSFAFADTNKSASPLEDGTYTVGIATDSDGIGKMFNIAAEDNNTCKLVVENGKMTASVRLNGTGYTKMFMGTKEEANAAAESEYISYTEDKDGRYVFQVPVESFDKLIPVAVCNARDNAWFGPHSLYFYVGVPKTTSIASLSANPEAINVNINKQLDNTNGYEVQCALDANFEDVKSTSEIENNQVTTLTFVNLKASTTHYFRVRTFKNINTKKVYSPWSSVVTAKTISELGRANITSISREVTKATPKWGKVANATGYVLEYSTASSFSSSKKITINGNIASKTVTGLKANKKYYFRVRAVRKVGNNTVYGSNSTIKTTVTLGLPVKTKLTKLTAKKKSIVVTWKKQTKNTTGYQIQYSTSKSFKGAKTTLVKSSKTTKATIKKLKSKKTYYVRVRTYRKAGSSYYYSSWSSKKSVKVK